MTSIHDILAGLRGFATSEAEKGTLFESLMVRFLKTDPVYASRFSNVWRWMEWPDRGAQVDTGVDLVAEDAATGGLVAIQCKFYAETHRLEAHDLGTFFTQLGKRVFSEGLIISTTDKWTKHAEEALADQTKPVGRLRVGDLDASPVNWDDFSLANVNHMPLRERKDLFPHQREAIADVVKGFKEHDRGKLIMACGTGKTFTSLRLVEEQVPAGGTVLFLVPSISLLSQTLREWSAEATEPMRFFAVCSDRSVGKNSEDMRIHDLAIPATTKADRCAAEFERGIVDGQKTVIFSTYQSIDVVSQAQALGVPKFDLVVCDEAHRTTGATVVGEDESAFVKVHDNSVIDAAKRVYMTATPRLYDQASKARAQEQSVEVASMDDETLFGPEFHRLGFGEAVERGLLADYKVLVLAVDEGAVAREFQQMMADNDGLKLDDVARIVGCINGLEKRQVDADRLDVDLRPMRRAVAFSRSIKDSNRAAELLVQVAEHMALNSRNPQPLWVDAKHVDGTFNVLARNERLDWLKEPVDEEHNRCRVLSNARCLSEGVDVPALDAVLFLNPRNSIVDVVQSVGRVMRTAKGKEFGYVILPIGVPADQAPEEALANNTKYKVVWQVLQALRAHDDRFNAMVNKIDMNKAKDDKLQVIAVGGGADSDEDGSSGTKAEQLAWNFATAEQWQDAIYAKIVAKVGDRRYWDDWTKKVAEIAQAHITRIKAILEDKDSNPAKEFEAFLDGLRGNLNESITPDEAIEMLAQHIITKPIFDALFGHYDFAANNPVAKTMELMLTSLDEHNLESENETLEGFYNQVRSRIEGIDNAAGKQKILTELYDKFFAAAFKKTVDKLGIVYTPIEIVDFILKSADDVLRQEFGQGLTDEGVHILDGFTGTGTFMVRLLQSGLIKPHDLARKYAEELHANEIMLLAYYIAAVNIETTYAELSGEEAPFPGLILTDTFQSWEDDDRQDLDIFPENNERLEKLKALPITVILGNPPYSSGQESANDDNANESYPSLDAQIRDTYAARSTATNKNSLYNSYIRAIKWATLRIKDRGVIAFVANGGWLDDNTADGMRLALADELSSIYIYNLRGNQRTAGEQSRREGGKVFGSGSRNTVAVFVLVKRPEHQSKVSLRYSEVGDYLSTAEKLALLAGQGSMFALDGRQIEPNDAGDWIRHRSEDFGAFLPIEQIFGTYSSGLKTNRDAWVYSPSLEDLRGRVGAMVQFFNSESSRISGTTKRPDLDPTRFSWNRADFANADRGVHYTVDDSFFRIASYRPFFRQHICFARQLNDMVYRLNELLLSETIARGFYLTGKSAAMEFTALAVPGLPDQAMFGGQTNGQYFSRWRYEADEPDDGALFSAPMPDGQLDLDAPVVDGYRRIDNITDAALKHFQKAFGGSFTKDDIFHYVYGLLHSPEYRETYGADLKKMLPRVPLVEDAKPFVKAGEKLMALHLDYEKADPFPLDGLNSKPSGDPYEFFAVRKMVFAKQRVDGKLVADKSSIVYNGHVTLSGIPEGAYRYMLGARSAVEWLIDRYQVKTDNASGIVNDPNDWSREVGDPRYILDLIARIVTVSLETMTIVDDLPALKIRE